ncbi:MAG: hypothetical protein V3U75_08300 [Methylococcaceae bacterium]
MEINILNITNRMPNRLLIIVAAAISLPVAANIPLSGSGDLPFPGDTGLPTTIVPIYADATESFTGTWDTTAALAWQGTFTGTPDRIIGTASFVGINTLNFSGLTNRVLPIKSFFGLGDLDRGSNGDEIISLRAWDASSSLITTPWLDEPTYQSGPGVQVASMLPNFTWNATTGTYSFDGNGQDGRGNPNTTVLMFNNQEILLLEVNDKTAFANFGLSAPPIPIPAAVWLFGSGLIGLLGVGRKPSSVSAPSI